MRVEGGAYSPSPVASLRARKVEKIFKQFDVNQDGRLNRQEMAALVIAVNPRVKFSDEQIRAILDEVFRTYGDFIDSEKGLSLEGLLRTYDDGAGDIDRDFDALGLHLDRESIGSGSGLDEDGTRKTAIVSIMDERPETGLARRGQNVGVWAASPNNGIVYDDTWRLIEDLEILLRRVESKIEARRKAKTLKKRPEMSNGIEASGELTICSEEGLKKNLQELGPDYSTFHKALTELRQKGDASRTQEEAFDVHMAMGRTLFDHGFYEEALISFKRATELKPADVRPHFRTGNTLYSLGNFYEAREAYELALEAAHSTSPQWTSLLPQIHVNLGIALEGEGMLLGACEHYREAAILNPTHYRALKLLGSALFGVGELRAAEKALGEAIFLKPDYADARCDLGSALHALGDDERAIVEFQKAIDLKPDHMDALYNLGGLLRDTGRFERAAEMYSKVLAIKPGHWQAQLNRAVSLLGAGDTEEARRPLKEAFKMTNRVELYDAIMHLKHLQKRPKEVPARSIQGYGGNALAEIHGATTVEASRFSRSNKKTTPRELLAHALSIRKFQKQTRLNRCNVQALGKELEILKQPTRIVEKNIRKADVEKILRRLLNFLGAEAFQGTMKAVNERVLNVLDRSGTGKVDLGLFFAVIAPICAGSADKRKSMAFDSLRWRGTRGVGAEIARGVAQMYFKYLRAVHMRVNERWEAQGQDEHANVSFPEFQEMFDNVELGFGMMDTLMKLEVGDRVRHNGLACAVCAYTITGPRFKEVNANFNLCSICYSEGKVPIHIKQEEYCFKEYNTETDAVKDKLRFLGSRG